MKIVSGILLAALLFFNAKHAWSGITNNMKPAELKMLTEIGLGNLFILPIGVASLAICLLVLFPQTFFLGNILSAMMILFIMAMALKAGNIKIALIEIPFLVMPLVLIWLGHPFKK